MSKFWDSQPTPLVIAEIGVNHNGDVALAKKMVDAAKDCGAHAAKFQSFTADRVSCRNTLSAPHVDDALGVEGTIYDLLGKICISFDDQKTLYAYCGEKGIPFVSTPFSPEDAEFLVSLDVPFIKISSTDVNNLPFLKQLAETGKPLLLSTGMATLAEVKAAVDVITKAGNTDLAILHCVSLYPPEAHELNLASIRTLMKEFPGLRVGFSDHTIGIWAATAATAMGATIIEKHFTLDKTMAGPDQAVSADPEELKIIVENCQKVFEAIGSAEKKPPEREAKNIEPFRRSIVTVTDLKPGDTITMDNIAFKRPATGITPDQLETVLGKTAGVKIPADTPLQPDMIQQQAPVG